MQANFATGASLFKRQDESVPEYFLSFSPMAPFFGVPWRFAPDLQIGAFGLPKAANAAVEDAVAVTERAQAEATEAAAEVTDAALQAAEQTAQTIEAAVETLREAAAQVEPQADATVEVVEETVEETAEELAVEPAGAAPATLLDAAPAEIDDLKRIKGVGPKLEAELNALGLYTFAQIAAMTPENLVWLDENLTSLRGRASRDNWIDQASALLAG